MMARRIALLTLATLVLGTCHSSPVRAGTLSYEILVDTSGLVPGTGGLIDLNLSASYPPGSPSVSALVSNVITDGIVSPGFASSDPATGPITGDLTTTGVSMNNTAYAQGGQNFSVGSFFDVFVTLSGSEVGPGAVGPLSGTVFTFTLFDSGIGMEQAILTVNPNSVVDGTVGISTSDVNILVIPQSPPVPEPSSVVLLGFGVVGVVAAKRHRKNRSA